jgi:hypothetical protein
VFLHDSSNAPTGGIRATSLQTAVHFGDGGYEYILGKDTNIISLSLSYGIFFLSYRIG